MRFIDAAALWLAVQAPVSLLLLGALIGAIVLLVIAALIERIRAAGNVRCALGFHDDDYVECMDAWHCWQCGRRTPDSVIIDRSYAQPVVAKRGHL
ncbi:hypothetical protein LK996_09250 [Lysobacter sp. A6]|uniref:Uncharacterized protein n=1 Tax=Noviluteimonas lactosilytica TaxID=2888523 RepID=A0ABS8JI31_9GAMM|nr:hypothetical protein [Lysobacter lactosilyticus]MCC8363260.1 hypothetical protein [Lysobacter lactosilyticus]